MDLANSLAEMRQCAVAIKEEGQICQAEESHEGFQSSERTELVVNRLLNLLETHPLLQMRPAEIRMFTLRPLYPIVKFLNLCSILFPGELTFVKRGRQGFA